MQSSPRIDAIQGPRATDRFAPFAPGGRAHPRSFFGQNRRHIGAETPEDAASVKEHGGKLGPPRDLARHRSTASCTVHPMNRAAPPMRAVCARDQQHSAAERRQALVGGDGVLGGRAAGCTDSGRLPQAALSHVDTWRRGPWSRVDSRRERLRRITINDLGVQLGNRTGLPSMLKHARLRPFASEDGTQLVAGRRRASAANVSPLPMLWDSPTEEGRIRRKADQWRRAPLRRHR